MFIQTRSLTIILVLAMLTLSGWAFLLNVQAAENDFSEASTAEQALVSLPIGETVYKISVESTGIYEITYTDLQNAGLTSANPNNLQLIHRGNTVAYQFIGNTNTVFEAGEKIRFFGEAYQADNDDRYFITDNVYWLLPNGTANNIAEAPTVGAGTTITNFQATLRLEENHIFDSLGYDHSNESEFNLDAVFWQQIYRPTSAESVTEQITFELPYPDKNNADQTVEIEHHIVSNKIFNTPGINHDLIFVINSQQTSSATHSFISFGDFMSAQQTIPISDLNDVAQTLDITLLRTEASNNYRAEVVYNFMTVTYPAELILHNNNLAFSADSTGNVTFEVGGFTSDAADSLIWDVTNPYQPVAHTASQVSNSSGVYRHTFNASHQSGDRYHATDANGISSVQSINAYTVPDISPANGNGAEWIAITHETFLTAVQTLAPHRASYSNLDTHVVTIDDIANIHNHGFVGPSAIKNYLQETYDTWSPQPKYVLLVGDSSFDPTGDLCVNCSYATNTGFDWDTNDVSYMPFNYATSDRFQGVVPSDYDFSLLAGNDLIPDIAIGRFSVETLTETNNVVNKIIQYETNLLTDAAWQDEIMFVHDQPDGYDFNSEIAKTTPYIPDEFNIEIAGQSTLGEDNVLPVQTALKNKLSSGMLLLNWRGHGSTVSWSGGADTIIDSQSAASFFNNLNQPVVILSMDCLDGNFAWPDRISGNQAYDSLSETVLRLNSVGSAAHWSSTGLGFPWEHEVLAKHFYQGLFEYGETTIGDAINYAKANYMSEGQHKSEVYSFLLQGDPAMLLYRPELESPTVTSSQASLAAGQQTAVSFTWTNQSPYTASNQSTVEYTLPPNTTIVGSSSNITVVTTINENGETIAIITFPAGIPGESTIAFNLTLEANTNGASLSPLEAEFNSYGISESVSTTLNDLVYLSIVVKP